jgi:hypothetical protein
MRAEKKVHVPTINGNPFETLKRGDVWRIKLPGGLSTRERVIKIMQLNTDTMIAMEVPYSTFNVTMNLREVTFIEKIPQE